ncbi:MAG: hypothetical protein GF349_02500 [Candidatus Magasanikbacteria bacterium]|nr:hypothetical protein [Candidatus Magasanikbacteria bacterium]
MKTQGSAKEERIRHWIDKKSNNIFWVSNGEKNIGLDVLFCYIDMAGFLQIFFAVGENEEFFRRHGVLEIKICNNSGQIFETIHYPFPIDIRHGVAKVYAEISPDPFSGFDKSGYALMEIALGSDDIALNFVAS